MSNTLYGSPTVYTKLHKNRFISEGHGRSRGNRDPIDALWLGSRAPLRTLHLRCAAGILCSRIYQGTASKPTGSRAERREFPRVARDTVTRHSPHQRGARLHLFSRELEPSLRNKATTFPFQIQGSVTRKRNRPVIASLFSFQMHGCNLSFGGRSSFGVCWQAARSCYVNVFLIQCSARTSF
jgi:hypothetical protein